MNDGSSGLVFPSLTGAFCIDLPKKNAVNFGYAHRIGTKLYTIIYFYGCETSAS